MQVSATIETRRLGFWIALHLLAWGVGPALAAESIPVVGCPSDGQTGPVDAPAASSDSVNLEPRIAARLAYYRAAEGPRVLAPRGWHCRMWDGSWGSELVVAPVVLQPGSSPKIAGPGMALTVLNGGTSGRFAVATYMEHLFPGEAQEFVSQVKGEMTELHVEESWNERSYASDTYRHVSPMFVEFKTPGAHDGLGTAGTLAKSDQPVSGVVILDDPDDEPYITVLRVRLPRELGALEATILSPVPRAQQSTVDRQE